VAPREVANEETVEIKIEKATEDKKMTIDVVSKEEEIINPKLETDLNPKNLKQVKVLDLEEEEMLQDLSKKALINNKDSRENRVITQEKIQEVC